MRRLMGALSDRHVEIMRDDLAAILHDATARDVEYLFDDQITALADDGTVTFERAPPRRFDVIVGADGLHSGSAGSSSAGGDTRWLGGHIAVL